MTFPAETVLLSAPNDDQSQADCMEYIRHYKLTSEDVKIAIRAHKYGEIRLVVAKREVTLAQ